MRTSGKTNNTPGWPSLHKTGPGREKHINRRAKASLLSCALGCSSPRVFRSTYPHASKMDFPAIFEIKLSCNTDLSKSYNIVYSRPESYNTVYPRPESCDTSRGLQCPSLQIFVVMRQRTEEHTLT